MYGLGKKFYVVYLVNTKTSQRGFAGLDAKTGEFVLFEYLISDSSVFDTYQLAQAFAFKYGLNQHAYFKFYIKDDEDLMRNDAGMQVAKS